MRVPGEGDSRSYYGDKRERLRDLFGASVVSVEAGKVLVDGQEHPVLDDVIILLPPGQRPEWVRTVSYTHLTLPTTPYV